jgi:hypothetical protein
MNINELPSDLTEPNMQPEPGSLSHQLHSEANELHSDANELHSRE